MRAVLFALILLLSAPAIARERAIAWEGVGVDGKGIRFAPDHLQRPAVLLFWATWCPYCKALMPHLQQVLDDAGQAQLDVYAIDIKDDGDPAAELRERGQTFTLVLDGDLIAQQYGVKGTPSLLLVDRKGEVIYRRVGGDSPENVEAMLRQKLGLGVNSAPAAPAAKP